MLCRKMLEAATIPLYYVVVKELDELVNKDNDIRNT